MHNTKFLISIYINLEQRFQVVIEILNVGWSAYSETEEIIQNCCQTTHQITDKHILYMHIHEVNSVFYSDFEKTLIILRKCI
jgi:hypothetical protein